ncbi:MAG: 1-(5-phosphoribosyl)-5-[(5-phosphoribosylamino)methylideneamino]imidazole-4-carboxamide isomerase [Candidatus Hydrogenedentota bacterium]|nr:MAG: 1-(5-phosphoribosyl)-5-[(5-phosphoribosylamino)methylideneamino]imidazole-4-carboxamide isomerase [Candidatus Hydrogenedentota bacterium]
MIVLPAIDLKGGRCVRLEQGKPDREKVYSDDPAEVARDLAQQGAQWLHVIDLDGAFAGEPRNLLPLTAIRRAVTIPIQFGGGNRRLETLDRVFTIGVDRVVVGTAALESPQLLREACEKFGERIAVGIDACNGKVAVKGWCDVTDIDAVEFGNRVAGEGAGLIVYTDILRDGMLCGPNKDALKRMADGVPVPIIASGGISTLTDVAEISKLAPGRITGMIIGKALYEGTFSLRRALDIAATSGSQDKRGR